MYFASKQVIILLILVYLGWRLVNFRKERFHSGTHPWFGKGGLWWDKASRNTVVPHIKYGSESDIPVQEDLTLTNLYRKWHNIENINRMEVLEHSHVKTPGGGGGINRQFYIAEAMDREAQRLQKLIRDEIAFRRRPRSYPYENNPPSPLGGSFNDCHLGDCQWDQDVEGKILGIPSVPGIRHTYY